MRSLVVILYHYYAIFAVQLCCSTRSIVSAIETYEYYSHERDALLQLRDLTKYSIRTGQDSRLHSNWTGPPCYQNQSRWAGIACLDWHVTDLVLDEMNLAGSLPPSFLHNITFLSKLSLRNNYFSGSLPDLTHLSHLEYVFLSRNSFSGPIPSHYIDLPKLTKLELQENSLGGSIPPFDQPTLKVFNVSYNRLEGPIPPNKVLESFPKNSFAHNTRLCGQLLGVPCQISPPVHPHPSPPANVPPKGKKVWSIALIAAAAAALVPFTIMLSFLFYFRRVLRGKRAKLGEVTLGREEKKKNYWSESAGQDPERTVNLEFFDKNTATAFDLDELLRASAKVMGKGTMGTTYKAKLELGPAVAVKRLTRETNALSKKEFADQMQLLGNTRHENLVKIISFYYSREEKLVIYEYVSQGNLFELLHENRGVGRVPLNWTARLSIIKEIAKGLTFLHQSLPPSYKVPHGNLKSSNVLIQHYRKNNYHSKLTDFGFFPLLPSRKSTAKLAVGKTPEFCQGKKLTFEADVYCFGIILLEVITGKIPGGANYSRRINGNNESVDDNGDLSDWVRAVVNTDWSTDILDVEILSAREEHDEMLRLTDIALQCTDMMPEKRPKMSQVLREIEEMEQTKC